VFSYSVVLSIGGGTRGTSCSMEYVPAELFAVSRTLPFSSSTSNIVVPGQGSLGSKQNYHYDFHTSVM
jgi:hypothetical protein